MTRARLPASLPDRTVSAYGRIRRALLAALGLALLSCSDNQVAGTSSGVDNPALTVGFKDAKGNAARVSGDLDVFAADQNPAVDAEPLATIKVKNSALTLVTGDDFKRAQSAASKRAAGTAGGDAPAERTRFNLIFRTQDGKGGIALGLAYDSAARAFSRSDSSVQSVTFVPKSLIRYVARIAKEPVHGADCRVFVPGSPFLATVADSQFVLEGLPQGKLPLDLIGSDGHIYPVPDSLNTADSGKLYRPSASPSGAIDTSAADTLPDFQVIAPAPHSANADDTDILEAKLVGITAEDRRLSVQWKWLPEPAPKADSAPHAGPGGPKPALSAEILSPAALRTGVRYHGEGLFRFQISATVGTRTRSDTAEVSVFRQPPQPPMVIHPTRPDTVVAAQPFTVQWQMPGPGPYAIEISMAPGEWISLAEGYVPPQGLQIYTWTPSSDLAPSDHWQLRVRDEVDTLQHAVSKEPFTLVH